MTTQRHWRDKPITDKQQATITQIESNTKHHFKGKDRGKAADFIGAHIDESISNARDMWAAVNREEDKDLNQFNSFTYDEEVFRDLGMPY